MVLVLTFSDIIDILSIIVMKGDSLMKLKHIKAHNFLSIKDMELNLDSQGLVLLDGKNKDSKDGSFEINGTGKSTLLASIYYALYGETPDGRSADAVINNLEKKKALVELTFDKEGNEYKIARGRKKNVLELTRDGEPVSFSTMKETQKHIEELIGIPEEVFRTTLFFDGHYTTPFSEMTDKQKKEFLSAVVDLEVYAKAHDKTKEDIKATKAELDTVISNIAIAKESSQRELENIKRLKDEDKVAQENLDKAIEAYNNYDTSVKEILSKELTEASRALEDVKALSYTNDAQNELTEAAKALQELANEGKELQADKKSLEIKKEQLKAVISNKVETIKQYEALNNNSYTKENLAEAHGYGVGGYSLDAINNIIPGASTNLDNLAELKTSLEQDVKTYKEIDTTINDAKIEELREVYVEKQQAYNILKEAADKEIANNATLNSQYKEASDRVENIKYKIRAEDNNLANLENAVTNAKERLRLIQEQLSSYGDSVSVGTKISELEENREKLSDKLVNLEKVLGAFSDKGIKSHVLDLVTPTLNKQVNTYLSTLSGGAIVVEFSTQSKKSDGTMTDKFDVNVKYNDREMSYKDLSSGEKRRVDVAISLALQDMVMQRYGTDINLLAYDELFESLDAIGSENVVELLKERADKVGTVIVVSHNQALKPLFDKVITMVKENGYSTLEGEVN